MIRFVQLLVVLWLASVPAQSRAETLDQLTVRGRGGDVDAMVELGYRYLHGLGVERDLHEAQRWLEVPTYTAQLPYAITWMGLAHLQQEEPSETDLTLALGFFGDAVELGDLEADIYLGWMVGNGLGTTVDREQGRRYIVRAMRNSVDGAEEKTSG
jgi:TPR repeat protein